MLVGSQLWIAKSGEPSASSTSAPGDGLARLGPDPTAANPHRTALPESGFSVAVAGSRVWVAGLEGRLFEVNARPAAWPWPPATCG